MHFHGKDHVAVKEKLGCDEARKRRKPPTERGHGRCQLTLVTKLPAPITQPAPMVTPPSTVTPPPIQQSSPMETGLPMDGMPKGPFRLDTSVVVSRAKNAQSERTGVSELTRSELHEIQHLANDFRRGHCQLARSTHRACRA
jgi:hypothetical protein